jgi:hypothetical protein
MSNFSDLMEEEEDEEEEEEEEEEEVVDFPCMLDISRSVSPPAIADSVSIGCVFITVHLGNVMLLFQ